MRPYAVAAVLGVVLVATALDLALGLLWSIMLVALLVLRRRIRAAAWLVLLLVGGLLVSASRLGGLGAPVPASYGTGWVPAWGAAASIPPSPEAATDPRILAARGQLEVLAQEELRLTGGELEQRAAALIALSRRLDPLRRDAPAEVAALEGAVRRLARTLGAPEFRDLGTRRAAAAAHLAELDRRLDATRDPSDAASILRAIDPAALAHVSLRPVREDLAAASVAAENLVRILGGGVPAATTSATARYDEGRRAVRWEIAYTIGGAPGVRLLRVETRAFRGVAPSGAPLTLAYAAGGEAPRAAPPGAWLELEPAPRGVAVVSAWAEPAMTRPLAARWRLLAFERLGIDIPGRVDDAVVTTVLDGRPGIEIPLAVRLPAPRLARIHVPRHALYFADGPGSASADAEGDTWEPAGPAGRSIGIELTAERWLLRNAAFASIRGYLYRPNAGTMAVTAGLAALTLILVRRPRPARVEG